MKKIHLIMVLLLCSNIATVSQPPSSIKKEALEKLLKRAAETHSDAVLVFKDSQLVGEYFSKERGKIELMSCTKSIVNIAIGQLIDAGKIKSLDQPVYEIYPEWKQGRKKLITMRHLLNHTSGLQNVPNTGVEIYPSSDFVKLALAAEVSDDPGSRFSYNNKAVNLLAGIVQSVSGKRMDIYVRDEILQPMGITDFDWTLDAAGNPHAMAGLQLKAADFAKFGLLLLNKGLWEGKRIVSEKWIEESLQQGQPHNPLCGLLWWRLPSYEIPVIDDEKFKQLEAAGVSKSFLSKLEPLRNKSFDSMAPLYKALAEIFGERWGEILNQELANKGLTLSRKKYGDIIGYNANGSLGQYLVVYPQQKLVAVRQIRWSDKYSQQTDSFDDFFELVRSLDK